MFNNDRGGFIMKTPIKILITLAMIIAIFNVYAQDDFYPSKNKKSKEVTIQPADEKINDSQYSTATDYYLDQKQAERDATYNQQMGITDSTTYYEDENGNTRITNNYYNSDNYDYNNEYYDYEYSSRIKRFHKPYSGYGYYDNCYTNYYWYDYNPYNYGVSVYTSYGWWYPRPWGWNVGWSWGSGWYAGWGIGWEWSNLYGYYGSSYWNGYNHGYNDGYYAGNYYNSYDKNSYYYGHRGNTTSSYGGYGRPNRPTRSTMAAINNNPRTGGVKTFGEQYENAIRNNTGNVNNQPRPMNNTFNNNGGVKGNSSNQTYTNPRTTTVQTANGIPRPMNPALNNPVKPRTSSTPDVIVPKPRTTGTTIPSTNPTYNQPRTNNPGGGTDPVYPKPKPRTYTQPSTQPTYNKPKDQNYSQPNNSYSRPSGNGYNRGNGSTPNVGGGGRKPR